MWSFQAVALDLDGTLAEDDQLAESAVDAIKASSRAADDLCDRADPR